MIRHASNAPGLTAADLRAPSRHASENVHPTSRLPEPEFIAENRTKDQYGNPITRRYRRGHLLGKGGFAKCYAFTDMETGKVWAGKVVQKSSLTKARHKAKLQTEIKIHKALNNENVVKIEEVFEDKDNVYLIMELCENQTLMEIVKRKKRLTEPEARYYIHQLLSACKYLHGVRVIHRDLKLGNLFMAAGDKMKIGDFGLASKLAFDGERKRTLCGTPNYIAPEVLDGRNGHSYEVDIWSIGVILYTVLVGKPPFETSDVKSTYKRIKANVYSFPERVPLSDASKHLVRRILQAEPERRPSLDDIINHEWCRGESVPRGITDRAPLRALTSDNVVDHERDAKPFNKYDRPSSAAPTRSTATTSSALTRPTTAATTSSKQPSAAERILSEFNRYHSTRTTATSSAVPSSRQPTGPLFNTNTTAPREQATTAQASGVISSVPAAAGGAGTKQPVQSARADEQLAAATKDLHLGSEAAPAQGEAEDEDRGTLHCMHLNLQKSFADNAAAAANGRHADEAPLPMPSVWVNKWVDYSKKYGLGYKLSDGTSGVFFNDATKMLLDPEAHFLEYIERVRTDSGAKQDIRRKHVYAAYPAELKKKVTLMQHFKNYLDDQSKDAASAGQTRDRSGGDSVYVRKWMRTRHSIIFRMSNNNFQVNFFDGTEVFLWSEHRWVTYLNKAKERKTYELGSVIQYPELAKRIKYVKDILSQLIGRS